MYQQIDIQARKVITQKWALHILFILSDKKRHSYKSIKNNLVIPNSTLSLRVVELTKYKFIQRYIYGSVTKPYYTDYEITEFGLNYLNDMYMKGF